MFKLIKFQNEFISNWGHKKGLKSGTTPDKNIKW